MQVLHFKINWVFTQECNRWILWQDRVYLCKKLANCLTKWLYHQFAFPPAVRDPVVLLPHQFLDFRNTQRWVMISDCGFNLNFPDAKWCLVSFHVLMCKSVFFGKVSGQIWGHFKFGLFVFLVLTFNCEPERLLSIYVKYLWKVTFAVWGMIKTKN